ncbi:MAG: ATP-binding protein [Bacteroidota bacterium]
MKRARHSRIRVKLPRIFRLELRSNPKFISRVEDFLRGVNRSLHLDEIQFNKLLVSTTEAVNNGIIHGNKMDPEKKVSIRCEVNTTAVVVRVKDEGAGFKPEEVPDPLREENLLLESGRGIFLMRTLMDHVDYFITPRGVEVIMRLNLNR